MEAKEELLRYVTCVNSALHPSGVAESSTSRQVVLCDPIWHMISRIEVRLVA